MEVTGELEQERKPGQLVLALALPEGHFLGLEKRNGGLDWKTTFIPGRKDIADSKIIQDPPEGIEYAVDPQDLPAVLQMRLPEPNGKTQDGQKEEALLVAKHKVDMGFDYEMTIPLAGGGIATINPYVFLRLVGMDAFYETSFEAGQKAVNQHMVLPVPDGETNALRLLVAPAEYKAGGGATFEALLEQVIKEMVRLDENGEFGKVGFKEALQKYPEFNGTREAGILARKFLGRQRREEKWEGDRDPLNIFLDGVQAMDLPALQRAAGSFADLLIQNPGSRRLLENQLAKADFTPSVSSAMVFPAQLNQEVQDLMRERMKQQMADGRGELAELRQRVRELGEELRKKREEAANLQRIIESTPDKQAELEKARSQLAQLNAQYGAELARIRETIATQEAERARAQASLADTEREVATLWAKVQAREAEKEGLQGWIEDPTKAEMPFVPGVIVRFRQGNIGPLQEWYLVGTDPQSGRAVLLRYDARDPRKYLRTETDFATLAQMNREGVSLIGKEEAETEKQRLMKEIVDGVEANFLKARQCSDTIVDEITPNNEDFHIKLRTPMPSRTIPDRKFQMTITNKDLIMSLLSGASSLDGSLYVNLRPGGESSLSRIEPIKIDMDQVINILGQTCERLGWSGEDLLHVIDDCDKRYAAYLDQNRDKKDERVYYKQKYLKAIQRHLHQRSASQGLTSGS